MRLLFTPPNCNNRLSNIELLRMLSMFLVLIVHADFFSIGVPAYDETVNNFVSSFMRFFFQSLSIVCVDVFILISGWFGIKPRVKNMANFIFQCLFFLIGIYVVMLFCGLEEWSVKGLLGCFFMLKWNWFIKAYLGLCLLAPFMNSYIERSTEKQMRMFLIWFYLFQTLYVWTTGAAVYFEDGYSAMSFVGLYMLARYVRLHPCRFTTLSAGKDFMIYGVTAFVGAVGAFLLVIFRLDSAIWRLYSYVCPLVILSSLYLLLGFSKLKIQSDGINFISSSCFAVFLLHTNPNLCIPYFKRIVNELYASTSGGQTLIYIGIFLILTFVAAVIIDQCRKMAWNRLWTFYESNLTKR